MPPHRPLASIPRLGVLAVLVTGVATSQPSDGAFAFAPLREEGAVSVWFAVDSGLDLTCVGVCRHPAGTRAAREVVLHPDGEFAYVVLDATDGSPGAVALHQIDRRTGELTFRGLVHQAPGPVEVALDARGAHAYVVERDGAALRTFDVDATRGTWRERHTPMPTGAGAAQVLVDPLGRFVFVLNRDSCSVSRYRLDDRGRPELAGEDVLLNGSIPVRACLAPGGAHLFVTIDTWDLVLSMAIDPRDGSLRTVNAVATGPDPAGLALHAGRSRLYVAERGTASVSAFDVELDTGRLGPRLGPFAAGAGARDVVLDAGGQRLWVTGGDGGVRGFELDGATAATRIEDRPAPGPLGALAGLGGPVTVQRRAFAVALTGPTALTLRAADPLDGRESRAELAFAADELAVDPLGTWVVAVGRRPGRLALVPVRQDGRLGPTGGAVLVAPEIVGTVAASPCGRRIAVASRTPPSVHVFEIDRRGAALRPVHSAALPAAPDAVLWDRTGRALCLAHTAADRVTLVPVDDGGFPGKPHSTAVEGGPGPLAISPAGDVLYVGLLAARSVLPCELDVEAGEIRTQPGLAVGLPSVPLGLRFEDHVLRVHLTADRVGVALRPHPATGALQALDGPRGVGVLEASAPGAVPASAGAAPAPPSAAGVQKLFLFAPAGPRGRSV